MSYRMGLNCSATKRALRHNCTRKKAPWAQFSLGPICIVTLTCPLKCERLLFGRYPMYFTTFESRNEYGCDPVGKYVVYAHANVYELHIFFEAKSSMTNLLSLADGITWQHAKRRIIKDNLRPNTLERNFSSYGINVKIPTNTTLRTLFSDRPYNVSET